MPDAFRLVFELACDRLFRLRYEHVISRAALNVTDRAPPTFRVGTYHSHDTQNVLLEEMSENENGFQALTSDWDRCLEHIHSDDSQFWRRTLFRTGFSIIESLNCRLAQRAIEVCSAGGKPSFNVTRIELLGEIEYTIQKNGTLKGRPRRTPFIPYTAFILRSLAEESGVEATFLSEHGWSQLQECVAVRDRLTHPKFDTDLSISDAELETLESAFYWFISTTKDIFDGSMIWGRDDG